ncbi:MAG: preprotein translocase subunit SecG [Candidatus Mycalebacterium zealandia]|nr:MAG: preprotein translocase subunit SecG [Candidatus Mycalebacterium zealandia]
MEVLTPFIETVHIVVALIMIVVILIQPSGTDELGTVFGGGTSESVFGAGGATPFLSKATRFMAIVFVSTSLLLGYISFTQSSESVFDGSVPQSQMIEFDGSTAPAEEGASGESSK